eukprot:TRINITY_DN100370_c0_g1_i1.p1 TRINITY_DN100370_c0_g1~~TRINITY_DN100370_c0_g1_i1.p1  ORF type:complete len:322 (-),score=80.12 TRINITY_DN100370_c0_g1_i1:100-981(-)
MPPRHHQHHKPKKSPAASPAVPHPGMAPKAVGPLPKAGVSTPPVIVPPLVMPPRPAAEDQAPPPPQAVPTPVPAEEVPTENKEAEQAPVIAEKMPPETEQGAFEFVKKLLWASKAMMASATEASLERTRRAAQTAKVKSAELGSQAKEVASDGKVQATAIGAAGGAAMLGAGGGTTGLVAGSAVGALAGFVPAFFTFGLSIPVGAAIGGSTGLAVGTLVGGTAGALGGGAAGFGAYAHRSQIREGAAKTLAKVSSGADFVKGRAAAASGFLQEKVARGRFMGGGTGGTAEASE